METNAPATHPEPANNATAPLQVEQDRHLKRKRPRDFKSRFPKPSKRPSFIENGSKSISNIHPSKKSNNQVTPAYSTYLVKALFIVHTSTLGLINVVDITYGLLQGRDYKLSSALKRDHLLYISALAVYYRLAYIGAVTKTTINPFLSALKNHIDNILLPDAICQYIETIGVVNLANGAKCVPFSPTWFDITTFDNHYVSPIEALPAELKEAAHSEYALYPHLILGYQECIARAYKSNLNFRKVDMNNIEGKKSMLSMYRINRDESIDAYGPEEMPEIECQLGAAYRFRNLDNRGLWFGADNYVLQEVSKARDFVATVLLNDQASRAMRDF